MSSKNFKKKGGKLPPLLQRGKGRKQKTKKTNKKKESKKMYIKKAKQIFYTEHMQFVLYKATLLHKSIVWDNAEHVKFDAKRYGFDFSKYDFAGIKEENVEENLTSILPGVYKNGFLTKRTRFTAQEVEAAFAFLQGFARAKFKNDCGLINPLPCRM